MTTILTISCNVKTSSGCTDMAHRGFRLPQPWVEIAGMTINSNEFHLDVFCFPFPLLHPLFYFLLSLFLYLAIGCNIDLVHSGRKIHITATKHQLQQNKPYRFATKQLKGNLTSLSTLKGMLHVRRFAHPIFTHVLYVFYI